MQGKIFTLANSEARNILKAWYLQLRLVNWQSPQGPVASYVHRENNFFFFNI